MRALLLLGLAFLFEAWFGEASAQERIVLNAPDKTYVTVIVKACPADPDSAERCVPAASGAQGFPSGMCPKAVAVPGGEGEEVRQHGLTRAERDAQFSNLGCIDVPIPPEVITGDMTMERCKSHAGYLASMQYLEGNATIEQKAVGAWACIANPYPASGVAGM